MDSLCDILIGVCVAVLLFLIGAVLSPSFCRCMIDELEKIDCERPAARVVVGPTPTPLPVEVE